MTQATHQDRIEKTVVLRASRERVWNAISDSARFGAWFGMDFDGPFVAGQDATGRIMPTQVDSEVAKIQEPHRGKPALFRIERIEPMTLFAFRWHPFAIDPARNYDDEPMTLVTFELEDAEGGVRLTITESGFAQLAADRREDAFKANNGGWEHQSRLIALYLDRTEDAGES
ncbi:SRPBCC family protein [Novosphingobium sp. BL-8A]|jgi:uncharacterized protein YndB with AHSA1/START domain|uniref:SRPBCC family protein n=1 Tax=Novosphingobium sp. BL-8A TaxID=3127639 RepID=UPI003756EA8F